MFNPDILAIATQEVGAIGRKLGHVSVAEVALPDLLYYTTDAVGLSDMVTKRALPAPYSSSPCLEGVLSYGFDFLKTFLHIRLANPAIGSEQRQFAEAVLKNFNPRSGVFSAFYVRLTEVVRPPLGASRARNGYAVGFETRHMDLRVGNSDRPACMSIGKAIYRLDEQSRTVESIYGAYESYFLDAIARFGLRNMPSYLGHCWGHLFESLAAPLALFRHPSHEADQEWLATALDPRAPEQRNNDNIFVRVEQNDFVPYVLVAIPMRHNKARPSLPIREIVLTDGAQQAQIQGLRSFLSLNGHTTVSIRPTNKSIHA
jgi:hypothetical protein